MLVYLAEDHELVAEGISRLLTDVPNISEIKVFKNGQLLFLACENRLPDLIFLDYEMPVWNGLKTLDELKQKYPHIPCMMLSMISDKAVIQNCIQHGAKAYMSKDSSLSEIETAVREVMSGELYYSNKILQSLAQVQFDPVQQDLERMKKSLSEREMEVLQKLCDGLGPKEIADELFLSYRTVETHKKNIMQKLELNSISKVIVLALKNNWVKS